MIGNYSDLQVAETALVEAPRPTTSCYLEPAALPDVLYEQMDYLLAHAGHDEPGCSDCLRLRQVVSALMRPFDS